MMVQSKTFLCSFHWVLLLVSFFYLFRVRLHARSRFLSFFFFSSSFHSTYTFARLPCPMFSKICNCCTPEWIETYFFRSCDTCCLTFAHNRVCAIFHALGALLCHICFCSNTVNLMMSSALYVKRVHNSCYCCCC